MVSITNLFYLSRNHRLFQWWNEPFSPIEYIKSQYPISNMHGIQYPCWKVDWRSVCNRRTGNLQSKRTNTSLTWDSISFALIESKHHFHRLFIYLLASNVCCGWFLTDFRTSDTQIVSYVFGLNLLSCGLLLSTIDCYTLYGSIIFQSKLAHHSDIDVGFYCHSACDQKRFDVTRWFHT